MYYIEQLVKVMILSVVGVALLVSNVYSQPQYQAKPLEFFGAIEQLTNTLLGQLAKIDSPIYGPVRKRAGYDRYHGLMPSYQSRSRGKVDILLQPFVFVDTGEVVRLKKSGQSVERILTRSVTKYKGDSLFSIKAMSQKNLKNAPGYIMYGVICLENENSGENCSLKTKDEEKSYRLYSSIVAQKTKKVVAKANVWISDKVSNLKYEQSIFDKDNPIYSKDKKLKHLLYMTTKAPIGAVVASPTYSTTTNECDFLEGILQDAINTYERKRYHEARRLFEKVAQCPQGQQMKTYAGIYKCNYHLGSMGRAEQAYAKLVAIGVETGKLEIKFLFKPNSIEFGTQTKGSSVSPAIEKEINQYPMRLRFIGKNLKGNKDCLQIVGHASKTGQAKYNRELSTKRALRIREILKEYLPSVNSKTTILGMGYSQCIRCYGTDDERDAIDRRVEFNIINCP